MIRFHSYRISIFLLVFPLVVILADSGRALRSHPSLNQHLSDKSIALIWPSNAINLSKLQELVAHYPSVNNFNIQFPNQFHWALTPDAIQNLVRGIQQRAQEYGVWGKLPDFVFSSLATGSRPDKQEVSIPLLMQSGDVKSQAVEIMRQLRSDELGLSGMLPDWLKECIIAFYDAVYSAFDYVQAQITSLLTMVLQK